MCKMRTWLFPRESKLPPDSSVQVNTYLLCRGFCSPTPLNKSQSWESSSTGFFPAYRFAKLHLNKYIKVLMPFSNYTDHPTIRQFRPGMRLLCLAGPDLAPVSCPVWKVPEKWEHKSLLWEEKNWGLISSASVLHQASHIQENDVLHIISHILPKEHLPWCYNCGESTKICQ